MSAASDLLDKAVAMLLPDHKLVLCSDAESHQGKVLLALARPDVACVLAIDAAEYDGRKVLDLAGLGDSLTDQPMHNAPDIEQMKQQRQAIRQRKTKQPEGVPA
jgi:hypothetical protein